MDTTSINDGGTAQGSSQAICFSSLDVALMRGRQQSTGSTGGGTKRRSSAASSSSSTASSASSPSSTTSPPVKSKRRLNEHLHTLDRAIKESRTRHSLPIELLTSFPTTTTMTNFEQPLSTTTTHHAGGSQGPNVGGLAFPPVVAQAASTIGLQASAPPSMHHRSHRLQISQMIGESICVAIPLIDRRDNHHRRGNDSGYRHTLIGAPSASSQALPIATATAASEPNHNHQHMQLEVQQQHLQLFDNARRPQRRRNGFILSTTELLEIASAANFDDDEEEEGSVGGGDDDAAVVSEEFVTATPSSVDIDHDLLDGAQVVDPMTKSLVLLDNLSIKNQKR